MHTHHEESDAAAAFAGLPVQWGRGRQTGRRTNRNAEAPVARRADMDRVRCCNAREDKTSGGLTVMGGWPGDI